VLEGVGAVNLVHVREEEPEVSEGFVWDGFELGKGVLVGNRLPKVRDKGSVGCLD
jgi:hypothetical protein